MSSQVLSRRTLLQGALSTTALAFNPVSRSWAASPAPGTVGLPRLDGKLLLDDAAREKAADDFGHVVHHRPWAVLVPGSVDDIVKMVRFARSQRLKIAASRGHGESHSYYGQAQVEGGVVIDMSALDTIHELTGESAWVDAGVRWNKLLKATTLLDRSPPTLTDYTGLSIGGTLSVGGIGGQTFRSGMQVDNVLELEVVTGKGELIRCSPQYQQALFNAVRGGLGQCGIIVRARLKLVKVPRMARRYTVQYKDLARFLKDQRRLIEEKRFDYVGGVVATKESGRVYLLQGAKYFSPGDAPSTCELLRGLAFDTEEEPEPSRSLLDFLNRLESDWQGESWKRPHPWIDMFLPEDAAETFVKKVLEQTSATDIGEGNLARGVILINVFSRAAVRAPLVQLPSGKTVVLFSLLRTAESSVEHAQELIKKNRAIYEQLVAAGGKRYGPGAIPMSPAEWEEHFKPVWKSFSEAKCQFDPDNILTPGQGIFPGI